MNEARNRNRRRDLSLLAGVALVASIFLAGPRGPKEPVYQGKALTQWILEAHDVGIFEQTDEMNTAMSVIGTNAIPFLLNEFTRPISRRRDRLRTWVNGHSPFRMRLRTDEGRVVVAGRGLMLLGTNAVPALPVLVRYLDDPRRGAFVMEICYALGDAALPCLTAGFASTNALAITNVLEALQRLRASP